MRKLLLVGLLLLSGCATTPQDLIAKIQEYTAQACQFQPTAATVAALIAAFYAPAAPAVGIIATVGEAICKAPVTKSATNRYGVQTLSKAVRAPNGKTYIVKGTVYR